MEKGNRNCIESPAVYECSFRLQRVGSVQLFTVRRQRGVQTVGVSLTAAYICSTVLLWQDKV